MIRLDAMQLLGEAEDGRDVPALTRRSSRVIRKIGRNFGHKARHLVLDLRVRLEAHIDVEDDLVEPGCLDLVQRLAICADEPKRTEFSVKSTGVTFCRRATMSMK